MSIRGIRRALSVPLFTRRHLERDVDAEMAFHVARRTEQLCAAGMPRDEAFAEATRRFGDLGRLRDECVDIDNADLRREHVMDFIDHTLSDIRFALRSFRRAPGFTAVALFTLVVGIAALTSIFSYFNAVYYGRLPYHDADRVAAISEERPLGRRSFSSVSLDALRLVRGATQSFERMTVYAEDGATILFGTEPQQIRVLDVDTAFVSFFALRPQIGRLPATEEIASDAPVAMISDVLWRTRYGADSATVGKPLVMNGRSFTIIGVLPVGFRFPWQTDAIVPLREVADSGSTTRETYVDVLGKLRPGASRERARRELAVIAPRLAQIDSKTYRGTQLLVRDEMLDRRAQQFLPLPSLFLGAGFFLLLIACANVTGLFYVRAAERTGEMAIRASLGARRTRLIRQALTESLLLSIIAALAGTWLATLLVRLWLHTIPTTGFPSWFHVAIDARVLAFVVGVVALVTIVVGLSPARAGTRFDLVRTLKQSGDGGMSARNAMRGSRRGLVVQLALSVALFVGGALLVRSFQRMTAIDLGYPAARIALVQPFFSRAQSAERGAPQRFAEDIVERSVHLPGVSAVAVRGFFGWLRDAPGVKPKPASLPRRNRPGLIPDGDTTRLVGFFVQNYRQYVVSDAYFNMLGLKLRSGRLFARDDAVGAAPVAVLSARAAALLWGADGAVGRTVSMGGVDGTFTVIGVVDDVHDLVGGRRGFNADAGITIYLSTRQALTSSPEILATSAGDLLAARSAIVDVVRSVDPLAVIWRGTTMASSLDEAFLVTKVFGGVVVALAVSALFLSVIGIYGVVAFGVAQRSREIGIRIALGGTSSNVLRMITRDAFRFVGAGLVLGLVLSIAVSRVEKSLLFGVSPLDPLTYLVVSVLFGGVALAACYIPARRATHIDPVSALRSE